ncbi:MAG: PAS domain S-box protein [Candidatus Margulisiibacteriota bacterium]|jgi:PAS domain S-box-containing protein
MTRSKSGIAGGLWFFIFVVLTLLAVCLIGLTYFNNQRDQLKILARNNLTAITNLKVDQIENWHQKQMEDAAFINEIPLVTKPFLLWLEGGRSAELKQEVLTWMRILKKHHKYENLCLVNRAGLVLLSENKNSPINIVDEQKLILDTLRSKQSTLCDFHRGANGRIKLDIGVPIMNDGDAAGVLILRIDPELFLFPLIQIWPVPSDSAETLLVRQQSGEVVFLNELRHKKDAALNLHFPVGTKYLPAAMAVRGVSRLLTGIDYRGVPVLAVGRPIPGTSWFIISKVDAREIYSPMLWIGLRAAAIGLLSLGLLGFGFYLIIRRQGEIELIESKENFERLVSASPDAVVAADLEGKITYASAEALKMNGIKNLEEMIGRNIFELVTPEQRNAARKSFQQTVETGLIKELEYSLLRRDGSQFVGSINAALTKNATEKPQGVIITVNDITYKKALERIVKDSAVKFQSLFDNMSSGVVIYLYRQNGSEDFIISDINRAAEQIEKVNRQAVVGRGVLEVFPGVKSFGLFDILLRVWRTGQPEHFPIGLYQDQRISGWRENYIYKLPTGEVVAVYDDITQRKQAEEKLAIESYRLQKSQELALVGSWDFDITNDILTWTDETYKIFNVPAGAPVSYDKFVGFVHPDDRAAVISAWQAALVSKQYDIEHRIIVDGRVKWVREKAELQSDKQGKAVRCIGAVVDITDFKRLVNIRDDFVNTVSHELRTPMAIIHEGVAQVLEGIHGPINEGQTRFLSTTLRSIDRLARIVNDLLDISRLESGRMEAKKEPLDIAQLMRETLAAFRPQAEKKGLELIERLPAAPVILNADRDEITEVLTNLIGNALKFTDKGRIEISCEENDKEVGCSVADTGRGIAAANLPKLFEKFTQFGRVAGGGEKGTAWDWRSSSR